MKRKIFIGSTPDLPDMSVVGVAGFSEGGSLELPRWASEFKSLKIVFYTGLSVTKSAWGELSTVEEIEISAFGNSLSGGSSVGILHELYDGYKVGFSKNVFRLPTEMAIEKYCHKHGFIGLDYFASNEQVRLFVEKCISEKQLKRKYAVEAYKSFNNHKQKEMEFFFLSENIKWIVFLRQVEITINFVLKKSVYLPPLSVPLMTSLRGALGAYGSSLDDAVADYNRSYKERVEALVHKVINERPHLFEHLPTSNRSLNCPICKEEVEVTPNILEPDDISWLWRHDELGGIISQRRLVGAYTLCKGCHESSYMSFRTHTPGMGILFEGMTTRNGGGTPLLWLFNFAFLRVHPKVWNLLN